MEDPKSAGHTNRLHQMKKILKEPALTENEQFFHAMFESHMAVMLLIDPSTGSIIDANKAAVNFYKYSREELQHMNIHDINMLAADEVKAEWMKALKDERNYFEFPHRLADGQIRQVEVYSSAFEFQGKSILYSIIHDITEKKLAEEALRESEEKFEVAFRSNPNAIILTELETGNIYEVNDTFYHLTGLIKKEVVGKSTLEIDLYIYPDDRDKMVEVLKEKGNFINRELKIRHRSGNVKHVLVSSEVLFTPYGQTMITTMQDITERKLLEEKQKKEHDLLQIIFDTVPAMISIYDPSISKVNLNKEIEVITGWTREDYEKTNIMELVYPDPEYRQEIATYMQSLEPGFRDIQMVCKDGSVKDTLWANVSMKDGRHIGIGIDNTERKKINLQLAEQNKTLTRINEVLEDFVHIAAHDLRSPIANLIQINELIESREDMESKMTMFGMLLPITLRLQRTVEGLLETVILQTQEDDTILKIRFEDIWKEVSEELKSEIENYSGEIRVNFNDAPEIRYVKMHLISIMRNLVSNAIKYSSGTQQPFIEISSRLQDDFVLLTVADNGIGIDLKKENENLFKPFRRFTKTAEGTGLGLYIIKNIIEKNGGHIHLESQPNVGTTFHCYLKEYPQGNHS
jgi:PAS domain S-box-containing protein